MFVLGLIEAANSINYGTVPLQFLVAAGRPSFVSCRRRVLRSMHHRTNQACFMESVG